MASFPSVSATLASKVTLLVMPRMVKSPVTLCVASPLASFKGSMLRKVNELVLCSDTLKKSSLLRWPTSLSPHSPSRSVHAMVSMLAMMLAAIKVPSSTDK